MALVKENTMRLHGTILTFILTALMSGGCGQQKEPEKKVEASKSPSGVAVVVGEEISRDDFAWYLNSRNAVPGNDMSQEARERLKEMVTVKALAQEAKKRGIHRQPAVRFAVEQMLSQRLIEQEVIEPALTREVSREEIDSYYRDHPDLYSIPRLVRLADIFIAAPASGGAEAREQGRSKARAILAEAREAEKVRFGFSSLVKKYSDQHQAYPLGDTGFFDFAGTPLGLDPALVDTAFSLAELGKVNDTVVETEAGFHVVMLVGQRPAVLKSLDSVAQEIENRIRREQIEHGKNMLSRSLVAERNVQYIEKEIDEVAGLVEAERNTKQKQSKGYGAEPMNLEAVK